MTTAGAGRGEDLEGTPLRSVYQPQVQVPSRDATLCAEYFARHQAKYNRADVGGVCVERLVWSEPETWCNRIDYLCDGGRLFVAGDLGDAIYITGAHDLAWWTRCDLHYFASKCDASEYGRGYKTWRDDVCRARVEEEVARMRADEDEAVDEDAVYNALYAINGGRDEWEEWMRASASELFGQDWWDFVPNFGVGPDQRCALHLAGLKAAMAQLRATDSLAGAPVPELTSGEAATSRSSPDDSARTPTRT